MVSLQNEEIHRYAQHVGRIPLKVSVFKQLYDDLSKIEKEHKSEDKEENYILFTTVKGTNSLQGAYLFNRNDVLGGDAAGTYQAPLRPEWSSLYHGSFHKDLKVLVLSKADLSPPQENASG